MNSLKASNLLYSFGVWCMPYKNRGHTHSKILYFIQLSYTFIQQYSKAIRMGGKPFFSLSLFGGVDGLETPNEHSVHYLYDCNDNFLDRTGGQANVKESRVVRGAKCPQLRTKSGAQAGEKPRIASAYYLIHIHNQSLFTQEMQICMSSRPVTGHLSRHFRGEMRRLYKVYNVLWSKRHIEKPEGLSA